MQNDTSPWDELEEISQIWKRGTNHGSLTDQFRNIAAKPNSIISVITELPFVNNIPPIAGKSANANGAESQWEDTCLDSSCPAALGLGSSKLSVEDWKVLNE